MTEFCDQDLTGAQFERVRLRDAGFTRVYLNDARMHAVDFTGADIRSSLFHRSRLRGVELVDVDICELQNVVVNGVDIAPLVDAELNRRMPDRAKMRPDDPAGFVEAWTILERLWEGTVARARTFPDAELHRGIDGEWSFIQTLRHLGFASAAWVGRMVSAMSRRGTRWTCRGTRRPDGTRSHGTATHDHRSTRYSRSEANAR